MTEAKQSKPTAPAEVKRSSEAIRLDIAKGNDDITRTVEQLNERIKEKLNWRLYVKDSPWLTLGAAAGIGFLAARVIRPGPSPQAKLVSAIAQEVHEVLKTRNKETAGNELLKATLLALALKLVAKATESKPAQPAEEGDNAAGEMK